MRIKSSNASNLTADYLYGQKIYPLPLIPVIKKHHRFWGEKKITSVYQSQLNLLQSAFFNYGSRRELSTIPYSIYIASNELISFLCTQNYTSDVKSLGKTEKVIFCVLLIRIGTLVELITLPAFNSCLPLQTEEVMLYRKGQNCIQRINFRLFSHSGHLVVNFKACLKASSAPLIFFRAR